MRVRRYETVFVLRPDLEEGEAKEIVQKLENVISKQEGTMVKKEEWGMRKMAYDVRRFSKGSYFLFDYIGPTRLIGELERNMKINEKVMKFLTVKKADHVDMEDIQKEREEAQRKQEEASKKVASWDTSPGEGGQEVPGEKIAGLDEEETEKTEGFEEEDTSLEEEDEEEENES